MPDVNLVVLFVIDGMRLNGLQQADTPHQQYFGRHPDGAGRGRFIAAGGLRLRPVQVQAQ